MSPLAICVTNVGLYMFFYKGTRIRNAKVINFFFRSKLAFMVRSVSTLKHFQINGLKDKLLLFSISSNN